KRRLELWFSPISCIACDCSILTTLFQVR
ncbi:hypothetical protein BIW11_02849, partial [Tropilaelaps mercedesae]